MTNKNNITRAVFWQHQQHTEQPDTARASTGLLNNWQLNSTQRAFVLSPARFSLYIGGIGSGKTYAGAVRAILRAQDHPGSLGLVGAPTYAMLRDTTQRILLELTPSALIATYHKSEQHLIFRNGSEILFRSLDVPNHARGLNLGWFWLDEATLCGHYAWQILKGRLRQRGQRTAAWATGTPQGRDGFWQDFEQEPHSNHALYRATTYANAHNLPTDYVEGLAYSGSFYAQEVLGLFVAFAGLVYQLDASHDGNIRAHRSLKPANELSANSEETPTPPLDFSPTPMLRHFSAESLPHPLPRGPFPRREGGWGLGPFMEVIGGIDWGYTNPTAALVIGLDGDGRAWVLEEFYQRRAALNEMVLPALLELTRRYGVQRWFCGPDEPEHIAALAAALAADGLPTQALRADNTIRPGIQTITSLLTRRADGTRGLYIAPTCVHTITEFGSYQYASAPDGSSSSPLPQTGEGLGVGAASELPLKQHDHCFGAGTPILTSTGEQAIETVQVGDLVLTRKGYRRVLAAGCTNTGAEVYCVEFSNGVQLIGTGNHPVWVVGRGWFPIDALRYAMQVETASITETTSCQRTAITSIQNRCASDVRSLSISTAARSVAIPLIPATGRGTIMCRGREIDRRATNHITGKSGSGRTGRYQRGITSITLTGTRSTAGWRILNVCQERSTCCAITASGNLSAWRGSVSGLTPSVLRLRPGIGQRRVGRGTRGTARRPGRAVSRGHSVVSTAGLSSRHGTRWHGNTAIARTNVGLLRDGRSMRMTSGGRVHGAGLSSAATATPICDSAPVRVLRVTSMPGRVPVFNLTVEDEPEYYAAGVLVHNCMDALRYALHTALGRAQTTGTYLATLQRSLTTHNHPS